MGQFKVHMFIFHHQEVVIHDVLCVWKPQFVFLVFKAGFSKEENKSRIHKYCMCMFWSTSCILKNTLNRHATYLRATFPYTFHSATFKNDI